MKTRKKKPAYPKLTRKAAKRVSKFVGEERRAGRPRTQAVAIAFSRERVLEKKARRRRAAKKTSKK